MRLFTTSCSPIHEWVYTDAPPIGKHMATCAFYKRHELKERVKLPVEGPSPFAEVTSLISWHIESKLLVDWRWTHFFNWL